MEHLWIADKKQLIEIVLNKNDGCHNYIISLIMLVLHNAHLYLRNYQ